jgi:hypothetical protein
MVQNTTERQQNQCHIEKKKDMHIREGLDGEWEEKRGKGGG